MIESALNDPSLLYAMLGLVCGAVIAWMWRGAELSKSRGDLEEQRDRLQELEIGHASLLSEREILAEQFEKLSIRVTALQQERDLLSSTNAALSARQSADQEKHKEQMALLENSKRQLAMEFENLANRIFEERGKKFSSDNQQSMESLLKPFGDQIHRFQSRINEVHEQSIRGNEGLAVELRNMMGVGLKMSDQAENLAKALKGDKKTTGNWGEVQLERTLQLAGLEPGSHYEAQSSFRDVEGKLRIPDFVIKLPDGKHLIIDSKVSLVDYDRAVAAETDEERHDALKAHGQALKRHIDDLSAKDYSSLSGMNSPELVFMFMPIEAAYIEALKFNKELFNDGYHKNVIMVSHTTLLPMLRTVASLWIAYRSNEEARAISEMAGEIYNKVCLVGQRLEDMGKTLSTTTDKYNKTVTALVGKQGLYGKVERFKSTAANAKGELPKTTTQHPTIEHDRLGVLSEPLGQTPPPSNLKDEPEI
ncbi:DNA recombination protein RmuC [Congregibacter variabilis]|uniref:DNA recombination protein RmuC n=1 Tax=Congregibacter variabilis TaxID=3081200 RepID=A0ABZ0HZZ4_9GAMM|nr:DNA recombination protein RmuC [Congregibacter sp. IMCC43200]